MLFIVLLFLIAGFTDILQLVSQHRESQLIITRVWTRCAPQLATIPVL